MTVSAHGLTIHINGVETILPVTELTTATEVSFETILELSELLPIEGATAEIEYATPVNRGRSKTLLSNTAAAGDKMPVRHGSHFHVRYI